MSITITDKSKIARVLEVSNIAQADMQELIGNYVPARSLHGLPSLQMPVEATVFISPERNRPHGSGVIVEHNGEKYLVTATHILGQKCIGKPTNLKVFERHGEKIEAIDLESMAMIYSSPLAHQKNLPVADLGIFAYNGNIRGVDVAEIPTTQLAVAVGYPGYFADRWLTDLSPLASIGNAFVPEERRKILTPYMQKLLEEHDLTDAPESIGKIVFTGVTQGGNSGGGLFTLDGKLMGICRGPEGSIGKETGNHEFYMLKKVLDSL
jgi:hypothetical protein